MFKSNFSHMNQKDTLLQAKQLIDTHVHETYGSELCDDPMVSVVIFTFNDKDFIRESIDSVIAQKTNFSYEVIIGDDCSTDGTTDIIREYQCLYPDKIRLLIADRNLWNPLPGIVGLTPLAALKTPRGKYIALHHGDDYWTDPLKLQKQVDFLEANPDYSLVFCNVKVIYQNKTHKTHLGYSDQAKPAEDGYLQIIKHPKQTTSLNDLVYGNYIHTPGVLFRNWILVDGIPKYMVKVSIGDWPLHLYSAKQGNLFYMDEVLAAYRVHDKGSWSQKTQFQQLKLVILQYPPLLNSGLFGKEIEQQLRKNTLRIFEELLSQKESKGRFRDISDIAIQISLTWRIFPIYLVVNIIRRKIAVNRLINPLRRAKKYLNFSRS